MVWLTCLLGTGRYPVTTSRRSNACSPRLLLVVLAPISAPKHLPTMSTWTGKACPLAGQDGSRIAGNAEVRTSGRPPPSSILHPSSSSELQTTGANYLIPQYCSHLYLRITLLPHHQGPTASAPCLIIYQQHMPTPMVWKPLGGHRVVRQLALTTIPAYS